MLCIIFYFIFLHCPLSGPVLTYISLLIIPCMIVYVTNKQEPWTLNLEDLKKYFGFYFMIFYIILLYDFILFSVFHVVALWGSCLCRAWTALGFVTQLVFTVLTAYKIQMLVRCKCLRSSLIEVHWRKIRACSSILQRLQYVTIYLLAVYLQRVLLH